MKAVILDLDGTLTETELLHAKAWELTLQKLNLKAEVSFSSVFGRRDSDVFSEFLGGKKMDEAYLKNVLDIKSRYYEELVKSANMTRCAKELLDRLESSGLKYAVVTSSRRRDAECVVRKFGISCNVLVTGDDVRNAKPDPEPIYLALKELNSKPQDVIAIGDSRYDIFAYKTAGIEKIYIVGSDLRDEEDRREQKVMYVKDLCSILQEMEEWKEGCPS